MLNRNNREVELCRQKFSHKATVAGHVYVCLGLLGDSGLVAYVNAELKAPHVFYRKVVLSSMSKIET
jgi:hypothetical protein